jgi:hypothetical protein
MQLSQAELVVATDEALDAFWEAIVRRFPDAVTGDLSPLTTIQLGTAAQEAVQEWVANNVPPFGE